MNALEVLSKNGLLARHLPNYEERPEQIEMAQVCTKAIDAKQCAVIEAGTGTGKSFAYLIPAIQNNQETGTRVIVSTANKTLQAQLVTKDLPFLQSVLGSFSYAISKGKTNYICIDKLERIDGELDPELEHWLSTTETGDIDEAPKRLGLHEVQALCVDDRCTRAKCQHYSTCWYYRAREQRLSSDVIVTNHAQLITQLVTPYAEIMLQEGERPVLVIDEAHQLESYAVNAISAEFSAFSFRGPLAPLAKQAAKVILQIARDQKMTKKDRDKAVGRKALFEELLALADVVEALGLGLEPDITDDLNELEREKAKVQQQKATILNLANNMRLFAMPQNPSIWVRHIVLDYKGRLFCKVTRHNVADVLQSIPELFSSVIYTSATLATAPDDFDFFMARNGVPRKALTLCVDSPFDYPHQCQIYLPEDAGIPNPTKDRQGYDQAVREQMTELVKASRGGALLLFTSYASMDRASQHLRWAVRYPVCTQNDGNKAELIHWLKVTPNAVLCATASFWEGVDIQGDALRLVAIDKLPFEAPNPVQTAREAAMGKNAFMGLRVPETTIKLKQGFGRLIRSTFDFGVVALLDSRLWTTGYGRHMVRSMPAAEPVHTLNDVICFYDEHMGNGRPIELDRDYTFLPDLYDPSDELIEELAAEAGGF